MIDLMFTSAEIVLLISFLFKDILYLRLASLVGLTGYVMAAFVAGVHVPGMKAIFVLNLLGILINLFQVSRIIVDRKPLLLPDKIKALYLNHFHKMTPREFHKLFQLATPSRHVKDEALIQQNEPVPQLMMVTNGEVSIIKNDRWIVDLGAGYFIGEMSFISGGMANAAVRVKTNEVECITWSKDKLVELERQNDSLYEKLTETDSA